jgi:LytR cell envelope-related transcriptional attenuator
VRSWVSAPPGSRLLGAILAVAGVALLVIGLITLRGRSPEDGNRPPGAAGGSSTSAPSTASSPPTTSPTATAAPTTNSPTTPAPTTPSAPRSSPSDRTTVPAPPQVPITVLNNSKVHGLGERVADQVRGKGWQVPLVGNFAGRIPVTTVYFTPGDAAGERAAQQFAAEFPAVQRVFPRYVGLPPTPAGIVLVVTRDWLVPDP